jgi:hypothetical protein
VYLITTSLRTSWFSFFLRLAFAPQDRRIRYSNDPCLWQRQSPRSPHADIVVVWSMPSTLAPREAARHQIRPFTRNKRYFPRQTTLGVLNHRYPPSHFLVVGTSGVTPRQRSIDAPGHRRAIVRFAEETNCPRIQRARPNANFRIGGDENDRHGMSQRQQVVLQIDPTHARHVDVRKHARGLMKA